MATLLLKSAPDADGTTALGRVISGSLKPQEDADVRHPEEDASTQNQHSPPIHAENTLVSEAVHADGENTEAPMGHEDPKIGTDNGFRESGEVMERCIDLPSGNREEDKEFRSQPLHILDPEYIAHSQSESLTDSPCSEDATDWEESDDENDFPIHIELFGKPPMDRGVQDLSQATQVVIEKQFSPAKAELLERLMKEFWVIFDQNWKAIPLQRGSTSPSGSGSGSPTSRPGSPKATTCSTTKRPRDNGNDEGQDENSGRGFKRFQNSLKASDTSDDSGLFACPFRKHNPKKYSVKEWRICALTGYKSVARLKSVFLFDSNVHADESLHCRAHLYRKHVIHWCQRCKGVFDTEKDLDDHIEAPQPCEYKASEPLDGITRKTKEQLQSRRKEHSGQTEAESWIKVYKILFPEQENVPHPCMFIKLFPQFSGFHH
jgi:hypothetical protein